ncbi:hypothetical protein Esti_002650 [Eimeria stiedai]
MTHCVFSEEDADAAVRAAHNAFPSWSLDTAARTRGMLLMKVADFLEENAEEIAQLESLNVGKPVGVARRAKQASDVTITVSHLRYYGGWADKISGGAYIPVLNSSQISCHTKREPVGVVVAIVPWNFPLALSVLKSAPALACGCTVVVKSSEKTPLSILAFCKLVQKAGFPPGVFNVVNGWGDTVGASLIQHPLVNKVSFTGSSAVGRKVAQECAATMKRVTLELGGKSPLVVLKDADIKKACKATWQGLFFNSGQCCVACSRILVQAEVYDQFTEQLKKCVEENAKLLHPQDEACTQGPIVDQKQLNTVLEYIEHGKKEGAKCILGGGKQEGNNPISIFQCCEYRDILEGGAICNVCSARGYWVLPTIFTDVTDDMRISREEIFGPVVCVSKFTTIEEAVKRANDTPYGLGAGVFTSSIALANYFVSRLHAGTVWVNTYLQGDTSVPFGGFKGSGYGREGGEEGLLPFLEIKTVVTSIEL